MRVTVVYDARGRIISLSIPGDKGNGISGIQQGGVIPQAGQDVNTLEVPVEFEKRPLTDLHQLLRVQQTGGTVRFVKATEFKEPFLREP
jgi:hypothetical protein